MDSGIFFPGQTTLEIISFQRVTATLMHLGLQDGCHLGLQDLCGVTKALELAQSMEAAETHANELDSVELHQANFCTTQGKSRSLVIAVDVSIVRASVNLRVQLAISVASQAILHLFAEPLNQTPNLKVHSSGNLRKERVLLGG
jgi:hypothetical protein